MTTSSVLQQRKSLFWRIHFWAALIASPFAIVAALTGILYIFTPQIEGYLQGSLDTVAVTGARQPLDAAVAAAQQAAPDGQRLKFVVPALAATDSVRVYFTPIAERKEMASAPSEHNHSGAGTKRSAAGAAAGERIPKGMIVYVNPYTAQVLGSHGEMDRFGTWSKRLHSSLLQGDGWRWMIELSASWLMVMLLTGVYLWWPRGQQAALPQANAKGRVAWKQWHGFVGVALSFMSLVILTTGLTWSRYAGDQIRQVVNNVGQAQPGVPRDLKSTPVPGVSAMSWEQVLQTARGQSPQVRMQMTPPRQAAEAMSTWRVANFDRSQPEKRFDLVLDAYSGQSLFYAGWDKQTAFSKATAIGIPFHRGEFGWWNQTLLLVFGLGVLFSLVSGWVMYFKRRARGLQGLPRLVPGAWRSTPMGAIVAAALLCAVMPLLAWSAIVVAALEGGLAWRARSPIIVA